MSHAVRIDYQGISIKCQSICEIAEKQICKLDKILNEMETGSTKLLNNQTKALRKEIEDIKLSLNDQINLVIEKAKVNSSMGTVTVDSDFMGKHERAHDVIDEAKNLESFVFNLTTNKIIEFESLLNQLLGDKLETQSERWKSLANRSEHMDMVLQRKINQISDEIVKQYVYLAWLEYPNDSFEELYEKGIQIKETAENNQYIKFESEKIEEIKAELRAENIDEKTIKKITGFTNESAKERIQNIRKQANAEIIDEKVRKKSVGIIVKAIKNRGFIIDNRSIVLDREKNQVSIIALKPSGARAEFKVFLDGKFEYCFNGYTGQACQQDIQPFMNDLEEVYGIKVINQIELWNGNPDKNTSMNYQTVNFKSNKG